jgi:alternate F1F0 ATPase F1 subunit epsilon
MTLRLRLRTPHGLQLDQPVSSIRAEDQDGWFGIAPGRPDLVAVLPAGLLIFRDADGEGFVALGGGLLHLLRGECRVMCRDAAFTRELGQIADRIEVLVQSRRERLETHRGVLAELARESLRRAGSGVQP